MSEQSNTPNQSPQIPQNENTAPSINESRSSPVNETAGQRKVRNFLTKLGLPTGLIAILLAVYSFYFTGESPDVITNTIDQIEGTDEKEKEKLPDLIERMENYLPTSTTNSTVTHDFYSLSYAEKYEQPEWVAYELYGDNLRKENKVERHSSFKADPMIKSGSAKPSDYTRSGYDRGHLAPAADMAFSEEAMKQSFFMSNISPQEPSFNRGIWRELEEQTRDWCLTSEHFYVVVGPVLTRRVKRRFGRDKALAAPRAYYKVLLDLKGPDQKAVGFIMPNEKSDAPLSDYMVSVDSVETLTGIDFFSELPDDLEENLESTFMPFRWPYDEERYQMRVAMWNEEFSYSKAYE